MVLPWVITSPKLVMVGIVLLFGEKLVFYNTGALV